MATYTLDRFPPPTVPPAAPSMPVLGDWWRAERGVGQGRRKGRKRTSEPCSTAAGAYRGKLAGRTVPTDLGACWARHRFPPRVTVCARHTVVPRYLCVCVCVCVCTVEWRRGAPSLVSEKAQERTFSCTPARTLEGRDGRGFLCPRLRFSPTTTVLPLRYTRGPWPIVSKAGAGESRSGEKRSGEHTP